MAKKYAKPKRLSESHPFTWRLDKEMSESFHKLKVANPRFLYFPSIEQWLRSSVWPIDPSYWTD